jgi:AraC-like DNA-binding protein
MIRTHPKKPSGHIIPVHQFEAASPNSALPFEIHSLTTNAIAQADFPHRHNFCQILYVTEGKGTHIIDFEPYPVQPIVLYFISPGQIHFWQAAAGIQGYVILFTSDFLVFDPQDPKGFHKLAFFHSLGRLPQLKLAQQQVMPIASIIQELVHEYNSCEIQRASALSAYLHILLVKIQRFYASGDEKENLAGASVLVRQFKYLVSEHYLTERSIQAYAERIGISTSHLSKLVKTMTGQTPGQIIRQTLVLEAKRLLANTDLTIEQISYRLAFDDPAYFGRFFKREAGMSPGAFRDYIREKYQAILE